MAQRVIGEIDLAAEPVSGDHEQRAHKHRKREAKRRRDAERPPESLERFRILAELVREGRQLVELADHKARYALIILGVLNAAVFLVITRAHLTGALSSAVRPWLISALAIYAVLTFLLMLHAIDCRAACEVSRPTICFRDARVSCAGMPLPRATLWPSKQRGVRREWSRSTMKW